MKKIFIFMLLTSLLASCEGLFDIDPPTQVKEEELFSSEQGFYDALMGVYVNAAKTDLYGQQLGYTFVDILANMYTVDENSANQLIQNYQYENLEVKPTTVSIWQGMYILIANCNNILKHLPGKEKMFYPGNYQLLEAETKALRAFLHFDLLRLYASSPLAGAQQKAIPYVDAISKVPFPQLTVEQVLEKIITDLEESVRLLKKSEPLLLGESGKAESFMDYLSPRGFRLGRNYRLNYYAVSALLARVYLYKGDTQKAYTYASIVYKSDYAIFSNVDDYTWTTDILAGFWAKTEEIETNSKIYFSANASSKKLILKSDFRNEIFEISKYQSVDVRGLRNFGSRDGSSEEFLSKYFKGSYCYPVIKRSEVYLILAETAAANQDDPLKYLDELRTARGLSGYPLDADDDIAAEIAKEYAKEFIGEGQLFYYYKRKNLVHFVANNYRHVTNMGESTYTLPIPDSEKIFGNIE